MPGARPRLATVRMTAVSGPSCQRSRRVGTTHFAYGPGDGGANLCWRTHPPWGWCAATVCRWPADLPRRTGETHGVHETLRLTTRRDGDFQSEGPGPSPWLVAGGLPEVDRLDFFRAPPVVARVEAGRADVRLLEEAPGASETRHYNEAGVPGYLLRRNGANCPCARR